MKGEAAFKEAAGPVDNHPRVSDTEKKVIGAIVTPLPPGGLEHTYIPSRVRTSQDAKGWNLRQMRTTCSVGDSV